MPGAIWTTEESHWTAEAFHNGLRGEALKREHDARFPDTPRSVWSLENAVYYREEAVERYDELQGLTDDRETEVKWDPTRGVLSGKEVRTVDEAMAYADMDPREWEVEYVKLKPYQSAMKLKDEDGVERPFVRQLMALEAKLSRVVGVDALRELRLELVEDVRAERSVEIPELSTSYDPGGFLAVFKLPDLHLGKLAWEDETGSNYDLEIAERDYLDTFRTLLARAQATGKLAGILIPVGDDFFHVDTPQNTTYAGTRQDVDSRWQKAFRAGRRIMTTVIREAAALAPTDAQVIPGNHDKTKTWYLGEVLDAVFHDVARVRVDNRPTSRKGYEFGNVLLGSTHGDKLKNKDLPNIMAREWPEAWGRTVFREWFLGHLHKHEEDEIGGVRLRRFNALSGTDAWHFENGFTSSLRSGAVNLYGAASGFSTAHHVNMIPTRPNPHTEPLRGPLSVG